MIAPNLVLTVAHNIFIRDRKLEVEAIKFYPGLNGEVKAMYEAEGFRYLPIFKNPKSKNKYDFALIKLKERVLSF